jgi:CubicO group peptidase (beta-lactamase class C family)
MATELQQPNLWPLYIKRLLGSQLIRPITQSNWYQPRAAMPGRHKPLALEIGPAPAEWVNPDVLEEVDHYLMNQNTNALLIMHKGKLVHAHYRNFKKHYTFNSMSMVKTIQAMAVGIAIEQGLIGSVHDAAADYLPEWKNDRRSEITIEHLLTMQSGLKSDLNLHGITVFPAIVPLYLGTNIKKHVLALPAISAPGHYFEYNNYNTQLLGLILERASGLSAAEFFSKYLWQPLDCQDASLWLDRDAGTARTFSTLFARPEDWLRVAHLFLSKGRYKGQQIVPATWLEQMVVPRDTAARGVKEGRGCYGYQTWLSAHDYGLVRGIPWFEAMHASAPFTDDSVFYFEGMRAQYLFVSPRHDLIMLRMGERPKKDWDGSWAINKLISGLKTA